MTLTERKIIHIDEDKCNGCGLCVTACHEGAIQMVDGKARLVSDIYCDGLGDCLGPCPTGAIELILRPAEDYDEVAVAARMQAAGNPRQGGCPGSMARSLKEEPGTTPATPAPTALPCGCPGSMSRSLKTDAPPVAVPAAADVREESELMNWPVQLRLIPPAAPYLKGADILLAADCAAVAVPGFHARYLRNRPVIIACPKLEDNEPQIAKLAEIIATAQPASLTVVRMEVPCCGGLVRIAEEAVRQSRRDVPVTAVTVRIDGSEV